MIKTAVLTDLYGTATGNKIRKYGIKCRRNLKWAHIRESRNDCSAFWPRNGGFRPSKTQRSVQFQGACQAACATERTSGFGTGKYPGFSGSEVVNLDHVGCTVVYCYLLLLVRPKSLRSPLFGPMPYLVTPHNNTSGAEKQSFCVFFCSFDMI